MRADRLLSMLMLLQTRGQMTAQALADELEISVRTVYRDIDALSMAGIPVYAERGPGGGCALLDNYRTTLTGLTEDEVRTLLMLSSLAPLADLGLGDEFKTALRKLIAALPAQFSAAEAHVRQRIHLDFAQWASTGERVPHLQTLHQAVWEDRRVHLTYQRPFPLADEVDWNLAPYGLVAKAGTWYLIAARRGHVNPYRISRITRAALTADRFDRPADFDLVTFWRQWCQITEHNRPVYPVTLRIAPALLPLLPLYLGDQVPDQIRCADPPDADGWVTLTLTFESLEIARHRILGLGRAVEVLTPEALRLSVIDFAQQIVDFYG